MNKTSLFDSIVDAYEDLKSTRGADAVDLVGIGCLGQLSIRLLNEETNYRHFADMGDREYWVYEPLSWSGDLSNLSRPVRPDLMITDDVEYNDLWQEIRDLCKGQPGSLSHPRLQEILYSTVVGYACVKDLMTGDRKTPGTLLEIVIESLAEVLTGLSRGGEISIPNHANITIDMHLHDQQELRKLAVPTKTSLRERYVQAYVHQYLLESVKNDFGLAEFKTVLMVIGDTQRLKDGVQFTCTPGQLALYHKYLSQLDAFYYLDPPLNYTRKAPFSGPNGNDLQIKEMKEFFETDLAGYADWIRNG